MIGTFLVSAAALIIAVLGCALLRPNEATDSKDKRPLDEGVSLR